MAISKYAYEPDKCDNTPCRGICDICCKKDKRVVHKYGMGLRGFSIGCQPKEGFLYREDDESGTYYDILAYDRRLTWEEVEAYELNYIGKVIE